MTHICYTTFMANVKIAYAKAHLAELLARVARGERIVISRYNTPMAELVPAPKAEKVQRKFGTGKGKAMLIDPRALDPMTDDEAEAFPSGPRLTRARSFRYPGCGPRLRWRRSTVAQGIRAALEPRGCTAYQRDLHFGDCHEARRGQAEDGRG